MTILPVAAVPFQHPRRYEDGVHIVRVLPRDGDDRVEDIARWAREIAQSAGLFMVGRDVCRAGCCVAASSSA